MKIFLIRHGESTSDVENRYGGDYDDELTEEGKNQARKLAEEIESEGIEKIYSSPRIRARSTARELFGQRKDKVVIIPSIRERNYYGLLTGMKMDEAAKMYPDLVPLLKDQNHTLPNSESYQSFSERIKGAWNQITTSPFRNVAVVTHAGPIRCIFRDVLGKGEIGSIGDCEVFCLSNDTGVWEES